MQEKASGLSRSQDVRYPPSAAVRNSPTAVYTEKAPTENRGFQTVEIVFSYVEVYQIALPPKAPLCKGGCQIVF